MNDSSGPSREDRLHQVSELLDRRRIAQARMLLRDALAADPDDPDLLVQAARADYLQDDNASARLVLQQVLARRPTHFDAQALLLALLTEDGDLVQAEQLALTMIHQHPQAPDLYAAYGRVMLRALHFAKARALGQEALRMDPENDFALRLLALCDLIELPRGTDSAALRRLLADNPEDRHTLGLVVSALIQSGDHRAALRGARELLRSDPNDPHWLGVVRALSLQNHWTMWPLWPLQRFGWAGSAALWLAGVLLVRGLGSSQSGLGSVAAWVVIGYAVYSWVWPPVLKRLLR